MHRQGINLNILATELTENWSKKKKLFFCGWLFSKYHLPQGPWIFPKSVVVISIWTHVILSAFSYRHFQKRNVFRKVLASLRTTNKSLSEKIFTISIPERMTEGEKSSRALWCGVPSGPKFNFWIRCCSLQFLPRSAIEHSSFLFLYSTCRFDIVCFTIQLCCEKYSTFKFTQFNIQLSKISNRKPVNDCQCGLRKLSNYSLSRG